ncbi:hypothetical protein RFI_28942 [Reticulomyxa filosa]|uniref:Uncharacterized protein n=1 Tax=Reticulomyxa filosa TaxID=46433 RepID=X6M5Z2_RETFI|nr:hypothetical protein RFI_28942 [Reticulomyxa filosa]|eukprot:ETO08445.1 hypothetical protein RFI_28942 [Reticulomyxa filosa]
MERKKKRRFKESIEEKKRGNERVAMNRIRETTMTTYQSKKYEPIVRSKACPVHRDNIDQHNNILEVWHAFYQDYIYVIEIDQEQNFSKSLKSAQNVKANTTTLSGQSNSKKHDQNGEQKTSIETLAQILEASAEITIEMESQQTEDVAFLKKYCGINGQKYLEALGIACRTRLVENATQYTSSEKECILKIVKVLRFDVKYYNQKGMIVQSFDQVKKKRTQGKITLRENIAPWASWKIQS